nr:pentatricopeptide repeat-containing protein, mitochondrial [Quercus suber]
MVSKDVVSFNAMIMGLTVNGEGEEALRLFSKMQEFGLQPNAGTFLGLLCACCHSGLAEKGRQIFVDMTSRSSVSLELEHYACYIDLLARVGLVEEEFELIIAGVVSHCLSSEVAYKGKGCQEAARMPYIEWIAEANEGSPSVGSFPVLARGAVITWELHLKWFASLPPPGTEIEVLQTHLGIRGPFKTIDLAVFALKLPLCSATSIMVYIAKC